MEAIFEAESSRDRVIFLGDALMFGPQPDEVLTGLRTMEALCLMGNHDTEILRPESFHDDGHPEHIDWLRWTREQLSPENLRFLETGFGGTQTAAIDGMTLRLHHGNFRFESGTRLFPDSPDSYFKQAAEMFPEKTILLGHSHVQYDMTREGTRFINPGSSGHARLGKPRSCYIVLQDGRFELKAVPYDIEKTVREMRKLPLPEDFKDDWIQSFRTGTIASRYDIKDFSALKEAGYR